MYVVGLTGGIGSGKSTVAGAFARLGVRVIDADQLARQVVAPGTDALQRIVRRFGTRVLTTEGQLQRRTLRDIIFADNQQRQWLESLLHPLITRAIAQAVANCTGDYCMVESPLLLETSQHQLVHRILVVDVDEATQQQRAVQRDHSDKTIIQSIIRAQIPRRQRLAAADDILDNELPPASLAPRVQVLHQQYLALARAHRQAAGSG